MPRQLLSRAPSCLFLMILGCVHGRVSSYSSGIIEHLRISDDQRVLACRDKEHGNVYLFDGKTVTTTGGYQFALSRDGEWFILLNHDNPGSARPNWVAHFRNLKTGRVGEFDLSIDPGKDVFLKGGDREAERSAGREVRQSNAVDVTILQGPAVRVASNNSTRVVQAARGTGDLAGEDSGPPPMPLAVADDETARWAIQLAPDSLAGRRTVWVTPSGRAVEITRDNTLPSDAANVAIYTLPGLLISPSDLDVSYANMRARHSRQPGDHSVDELQRLVAERKGESGGEN